MIKNKFLLIIFILTLLTGCGNQNSSAPVTPDPVDPTPLLPCSSFENIPDKTNGLREDFENWLLANGYQDVASAGVVMQYEGNCENDNNIPVIGVNKLWQYNFLYYHDYCQMFMFRPYYDDGKLNHRASHMARLRRLIDAVKKYTNKDKVVVIGYSFGVTFARKAIQGGVAYESSNQSKNTACDLGENLKDSVETFIGIGGLNRGNKACGTWPNAYTSEINCQANGVSVDNPFIVDINGGKLNNLNPVPIADYTFSIYSDYDCVAGGGDKNTEGTSCSYIQGIHTSRIPGENGSYAYNNTTFNNAHSDLQVMTEEIEDHIITQHTVPE